MINLNYRYDQNTVRLEVEGLPDFSQGQAEDKLGILSTWKLQILGFPQLEGKKEHLQNLIGVLYPYAQHYIHGQPFSFGDDSSPVSIYNINNKHKLILRSSQKEIPPLEIILDDSEISDLIYCLDMLLDDKRILLKLDIPYIKPLPKERKLNTLLNIKSILAPILGLSLLISVSSLLLLIPLPYENDNSTLIKKQLPNKEQ